MAFDIGVLSRMVRGYLKSHEMAFIMNRLHAQAIDTWSCLLPKFCRYVIFEA